MKRLNDSDEDYGVRESRYDEKQWEKAWDNDWEESRIKIKTACWDSEDKKYTKHDKYVKVSKIMGFDSKFFLSVGTCIFIFCKAALK